MVPTTDLSRSDYAAYVAKMRDLVGGRDRVQILAETPARLAEILSGHTAEKLTSRPFENKWTSAEILGHLADTEWVFGYRLRLILCEKEPTILDMDHEGWVTGQRHNERDPSELLEAFSSLRNVNVSTWRRVSPEELQRVGHHNERGTESLDTMLTLQSGHDLSHLDQITRFLAETHG